MAATHIVRSRRDADQRLAALAAEQSGLFTRRQAVECGFSTYQLRRRLLAGLWRRVLGSALAPAGLVLTPAVRDAAGLLTVAGAILAGPSAARRHGMPTRDPRCFLAVPRGYHRILPGVRWLREPVPDHDLVLIDGTLLTTRPRTVVDCLRVLPDDEAVDLLDRALQAGWLTPGELARRARGAAGRWGAARLARFSQLAGADARSAAERIAVRLLHLGGVAGWRANAEIYDECGLIGVGDVVFAEARLVVEIDGRAHHVSPERFQRDRTRQNRLVVAGWRVLRFTWCDLTERPEHVLREIRRVSGRAS